MAILSISLTQDPITTAREWLDAAAESEPINPSAAALATVDDDGRPTVRMVLVKAVDAHGFVFYTNTASRKAAHLARDPRAALCLYWKSLRRQLRVEGRVAPVGEAEADAYFGTRERASQIGAWASRQSATLASRAVLEAAVAAVEGRFGEGRVPRPGFWSGYRLSVDVIEFWSEQPSRLHDRVEFRRTGEGWERRLLYP